MSSAAKKSDATEALYDAVVAYVEAHGGKLAVIGGVQIQEWPGDRSATFVVAVKCTGRKPKFALDPEKATRGQPTPK